MTKTPQGASMNELTREQGLAQWLKDNAPDCGDNSCLFGGANKGGMRTNGGCRCFKDLPFSRRVYVERLYRHAAALSDMASLDGAGEKVPSAAMLALCSLTPGGSEYANDPAACVNYVMKIREMQHDTIVKFKLERDEARKELSKGIPVEHASPTPSAQAAHTEREGE